MTIGRIRLRARFGKTQNEWEGSGVHSVAENLPVGSFSCHRMDVGAVLFILWNTTIVGKRLKRGKPIKVGRGANLIVFGEIVQKG